MASITECREAPPHQKVWSEESCCSGIACHLFIVLTRNAWDILNVKLVVFVSCHLLTEDVMDTEVMDDVPLKKQKVVERCKFWPVCKSGDECLYHHPTTQCK